MSLRLPGLRGKSESRRREREKEKFLDKILRDRYGLEDMMGRSARGLVRGGQGLGLGGPRCYQTHLCSIARHASRWKAAVWKPRATKTNGGGKGQGEGELCFENKVVIVGAGIAGLSLAVALKRKGIDFVVLEKADERRDGGTAIALWENAWRALEALDVAQDLRSKHDKLDRIQLCAAEGKVLKEFSLDQNCDGAPHEFRGVFRGELLDALGKQLEKTDIQYGYSVVEAKSTGQGTAMIGTEDGQEIVCKAVVGCDGIGAKVCGLPKPRFSGYSAVRGVAEFSRGIPFEANTVRQIFGRGVRAGMYPLSRTSVYWFVCFNSEADWISRGADLGGYVKDLTSSWQHNISDVIEATKPESMIAAPISDRWLAPFNQVGVGNVTCCGDALHLMTPNLGQGGCCAIEDSIILANRISSYSETQMSEAFRDFEKVRLQRCFPLTVRANVMGQLLQIDNPVVCTLRDAVVENAYDPSHFLDHTNYDCRLA